MYISARQQAIWWGIAAAVLMLVLWRLGQAIMPFVLGAGIAYLLDPLVDRLQRAGLSRPLAVVLLTVWVLLMLIAAILGLAPVLLQQLEDLVVGAPQMVSNLLAFLGRHFPTLLAGEGTITDNLDRVGELVTERGGEWFGTILSQLMNVVSVIALLVVAPVVAFYLLLDWDHMLERIDALLPRQHLETLRGLAREVDDTLAGFLRGQLMVMTLLGSYLSIALWMLGVPYAFAIGLISGLVSIIPYLGTMIGLVLAMGVALYHFWGDWFQIGLVALAYGAGQLVEGNVLQPKIVGSHVRLHPVWLLLSLAVFGSLFGFVGMIVAVPLAASLGVLVRFAAEKYTESPLYTGFGTAVPEPPKMLVEVVQPGTISQSVEPEAAGPHLPRKHDPAGPKFDPDAANGRERD